MKGKQRLEDEVVEVESPQPRLPHSQPWHQVGPLVRDSLLLKGILTVRVQGIGVREAVLLELSVLAVRRSTMDLASEVEQRGPQRDFRVLDWDENYPTDRQNHPSLLGLKLIVRGILMKSRNRRFEKVT